MNVGDVSALLNICHRFAAFLGIKRRRSKKISTTDTLKSYDELLQPTLKFFPVGIFPQEFEFVALTEIRVIASTVPLFDSFEEFSVHYELKSRRVDEVEITLMFIEPQFSRLCTEKFYISIDTSNSTGFTKGSKDISEVELKKRSIVFAYISSIKYKDSDESWSIEGNRKQLLKDTMELFEKIICDKTP